MTKHKDIQRTPSDVNVEAGYVVVDGPDGIALTMTPEAAKETSRRLNAAADAASAALKPAR